MNTSKKIAFVGDTNSGKTFHAMKLALASDACIVGTYLRLGAYELYKKACAAIGEDRCACHTGEDGYVGAENASHIFCTYEKAATYEITHMLVIDEYHQVAEYSTRSLAIRNLEKRAKGKTIVYCAAPDAKEHLISKGCEVQELDRRSPFPIETPSRLLAETLDKTIVIVAAVKEIDYLAERLTEETGFTVGVIYGGMPTRAKYEIAQKFDCGEIDIIVATSAVSYGINTTAETILFAGVINRNWSNEDIYQMISRAGRGNVQGSYGLISDALGDTDGEWLRDMHQREFAKAIESRKNHEFSIPKKGEIEDDSYEPSEVCGVYDIEDFIYYPEPSEED